MRCDKQGLTRCQRELGPHLIQDGQASKRAVTVLDTAPAIPPAAKSLTFSSRSEEATSLACESLRPINEGAQSVL